MISNEEASYPHVSSRVEHDLTTDIPVLIDWIQEELNVAWNHAQMLADRLNRGRGGRECALCITKIEEALHRMKDVKHQLEIEAL
jgi:hypothetical protein